jgi:hypothetical protein
MFPLILPKVMVCPLDARNSNSEEELKEELRRKKN